MLKKIKSKLNFNYNKKLFKILMGYSEGYKLKIVFITFIKVINGLSSIAIALITKEIIDAAVSKEKETIIFFGITLTAILFGKIVLNRFVSIYKIKVRSDLKNEIQAGVIRSIYQMEFLESTHYKTGDFTTRTSNDVSKIVNIILSTLPNIVTLVIQLITAFWVLSSFDNLIAITAFIIGPTTILFSALVGFKLKKLQAEIQIAISNQKSHVTESLQNIELIKTFQIEEKQLDKLDHYQQERKRLRLKKGILKAIANTILDVGFTVGRLGAVLIGAYKLYLGAISFGTFTAFAQLVAYIQNPMYSLSKTLPSIITVLVSVERIEELKSESTDSEIAFTNTEDIQGITFNNVSFAYKESEPVLVNQSLTIKANEHTAIIGKSGNGKTTLIRLMLALIKPQDGHIAVETQDNTFRALETGDRQLFSYVPQQNSLFSGTLRDNMLLMNKHASDEQINQALKTACIETFIHSLPDQLDTNIGERLEGLSHGQAQRLCIARALVHNTPYLILDEATSAIDQETEKNIYHSIIKNYPNKTIIGITHRNTMLDVCSQVINIG